MKLFVWLALVWSALCAPASAQSAYGDFSLAAIVPCAQTGTCMPSQIGGLRLWLRSDVGTFTDAGCSVAATNAQTVQCWQDQSGNGNNATQATSANRPTYNTNQVNGLPALTFDGANAYLNSGYAGEPVTAIVVYAAYGQATNYNTIEYALLGADTTNGGTNGSYYFRASVHNGTNQGQPGPAQFIRDNTSGTLFITSASQPKVNTWDILGEIGSGSSSVTMYRQAFAMGTVSFTGTATNITTPVIGAAWFPHGTLEASKFKGQIAEVIIYNRALSSGEYSSLVAWLVNRYGLATSGPYMLAGMMVSASITQDFGLYILQSSDGINWKSRPTNLVPDTTNTGSLQDPAILLASNQANGTGLNWIASTNYLNNVNTKAHTIDLYSSPDLFTWTHVQAIDLSSFTGTGAGSRTLNPYWFVDTDNSIHVLASAGGTNSGFIEVHPPSSSNFSGTWSLPVGVFNANVAQPGPYDPVLIQQGSTYMLWYANFVDGTHTYIQTATGPSLFGTYTITNSGDWAGWYAQVGSLEQPAPINIGGTWYTYSFGISGTFKTYYATSSTLGGTQSALTAITTNFANSGVIQDATLAK